MQVQPNSLVGGEIPRAKESVEGNRVTETAMGALKISLLTREGTVKADVQNPIHEQLVDYLSQSPTAWHAVLAAKELCVAKGYTVIDEKELWKIEPGGKYFVSRNGSSFIAFCMPLLKPKSVCILGAHTDSPGLKLKPNPEVKIDNVTLLSPEVYGGPVINSWFDRSLGLAGRFTYIDEEQIKISTLIRTGTIGTISNVAVHLEHSLGNELIINRQEHLPAICWIDSEEKEGSQFEGLLRKFVPFSKLLSHELFLVPNEKPEIVNGNQIHSAKLDNLLGTHASLHALLASQKPEENRMKVVVCWDSEEVGSQTYQGAGSDFLPATLKRACGLPEGEFSALMANSGLISIDVAHARHPNYYSKHEPMHAPLLGKGPVIKYHANQSYGTNSGTDAWIYEAGEKASVPIQKFCIRSDTRCGSTIGNIVAPQLGLRTVDIGAPVLAMHSTREKGHLQDHLYMCSLLETLLSMEL